MAAGGVRALVAFVVLCLLAAAPCANAAVSCPKVASSIAPCVNYIRGKGPLTPACCNGSQQVLLAPDRRVELIVSCATSFKMVH
ncbi:unnamed protein product [Spirodela intermedia]|uniref:Uncharacterized protein n=1 Tax=Spirodela intermedia TaxID=51605 RepID=A0A7I8JGI3_SPIIN|nr:unnamed protein product [Spirodela intermedia]CAA6669246.1 unnamed protein product [Spirodela intermedia]